MIHSAQRVIQNIKEASGNSPVLFVSLWIGIFLVIFAVLFQFGLVPQALQEDNGNTNTQVNTTASEPVEVPGGNQEVLAQGSEQNAVRSEEAAFLPKRVVSDAAGVDIVVRNPESTDINVLNEELQNGAVRYPGSGDLEDVSNMFIFGHSSYLPSVINENYQAFNGIQNLEKGDVIRVQSDTHEYVYVTETVELVDATEAWVEFTTGEKTLTLSTCNVFGKKQDRYVVTAKFVGKYEI